LLVLRAALDDLEKATENARAEAEALRKKIQQAQSALPQSEEGAESGRARVLDMQEELKALEAKIQAMRAAAKDDSGDATRSVVGEGRRQYLSGLTVKGSHILLLVDASGSMAADTIVEAVRRRNMDVSAQLAAPKWRRAVAAVDWLTAQVPPSAKFQVYLFNDQVTAAVAGTEGRWLDATDGKELDRAVASLRQTPPAKGTSLARAFAAIAPLNPAPDAVYLVTDGLPTMGKVPQTGTVSGKQRVRFFDEAVQALPKKVPVHVILLPMEGDPKAGAAFWALAQRTGGTYFTPSKDWP
ncbi:MAG TPA: hypothetical protein VJM11_19615, partial [Nevskiaceae bacterium]|nr:hypothetical protein [Nevskiaceae bacterium]